MERGKVNFQIVILKLNNFVSLNISSTVSVAVSLGSFLNSFAHVSVGFKIRSAV